MCMVKIFQDVAGGGSGQFFPDTAQAMKTNTSATTCLRSRSFMRSKSISFRAKTYNAFKGPQLFLPEEKKLTTPSCFLLTFRMIPNDPFPITSRGS